jgi:hypothetical protein
VVGVATLSTRNKIAAALALVSAAVLFIASGYRGNLAIYRAIESSIENSQYRVAII